MVCSLHHLFLILVGSLIYITLQRAKTAREAIATMVLLTDQFGYASEGESFSISDPNEVWVMDFIGLFQSICTSVSLHLNQEKVTLVKEPSGLLEESHQEWSVLMLIKLESQPSHV